MKNGSTTEISSFRTAIRTAARVARRRAFRKNLPVAISRNGKVVFVYKNNEEVTANSPAIIKSK
jgi:DNA integrity scanning protein DisA with diadenylate cyclase activity